MTDKPFIHPATPSKLKTEFRRARYKFHALAKARGINVRYIHDLISKGIEPTNPNIRQKLFLPKKPRNARAEPKPYTEPPEHIKWWRSLKKDIRQYAIQDLYERTKPHANQNP